VGPAKDGEEGKEKMLTGWYHDLWNVQIGEEEKKQKEEEAKKKKKQTEKKKEEEEEEEEEKEDTGKEGVEAVRLKLQQAEEELRTTRKELEEANARLTLSAETSTQNDGGQALEDASPEELDSIIKKSEEAKMARKRERDSLMLKGKSGGGGSGNGEGAGNGDISNQPTEAVPGATDESKQGDSQQETGAGSESPESSENAPQKNKRRQNRGQNRRRGGGGGGGK
jgi:hypothetical protein